MLNMLKCTVLIALLSATQTHAVEFVFQSLDPAGSPNYEFQKAWTETLEKDTDGKVKIELLAVGSVVEYKETQDAVGAGIIDGHIADTSYFSGKDPAFGLIANPVGAWSDPKVMLDFMANGGGNELMAEMLEPYGLHFIGATTPGLEAFVSKKPLKGVSDLKGLKLRAPEGLVQKVFAAAGAVPVNLPGSEVFTALDKGVIEAADYTVFSVNAAQGLHDVAKNPVYPGFHSMPLVEISMNKKKWDALPEDLQIAITDSVTKYSNSLVEAVIEKDAEAVAKAKKSGDIQVHDWSAEERAKFTSIAKTVWEEVAVASENSQKVYDVLTAYLESKGLLN